MAVFRRNTLCISRKSDEVRAQFFQEAPMADCAVLPKNKMSEVLSMFEKLIEILKANPKNENKTLNNNSKKQTNLYLLKCK